MLEEKMSFAQEVTIKIEKVQLEGSLHIPSEAKGLVLFAHGSGSSRKSPRNKLVAKFLQDSNIATLLFDLLTPQEEELDLNTRIFRFNIPLLAERLLGATHWVSQLPQTHHLSLGYFGASTGSAAALIAASEFNAIRAVVSRGGRPDLAGNSLNHIQAATLLIVGGNDFGVIELNRQAFELLQCKKKLEIIPNATHLFEEPGTLEEVGRMASLWFREYL